MDMKDELGFYVMAAICQGRGIGYKRKLPWPPIKEDYSYYMEITSRVSSPERKCVSIQGRKSWEGTGIPQRKRKSVFNIVITGDPRYIEQLSSDPDVHKVVTSFDEAIDFSFAAENKELFEAVWVMGGQRVFEEAVRHPLCKRIYLTEVYHEFPSDVFFPVIEESKYREISKSDVREDNGLQFVFKIYERIKD